MIGWLLKNLIQEVPEELAICEFDCPNNECAVRDWAKCELRRQTSLYGSGINLYNTRMVRIEAPALKTPGFAKAELIKPLSGF
jgi:hypothetical protein